jgi:methionine-gamma-lyase
MRLSPKHKPQALATRAIHYGYDPMRHEGALSTPVFLTSTFAFPTAESGGRRFAGTEEGYIYSRLGNPTARVLEDRLANLEGGEAGLATSSGMGAIASAVWSLVEAGDEVVADTTLYGGTFAFFHDGLRRFGVKVHFVDLTNPEMLSSAITRRTKLVFLETPANPNMRLVDIAAVARTAHECGAALVVDNTYCTPVLQRPLELGADYVVHSATKYLGGHGDLIAGVLVGPKEGIDRARKVGLKDMTGAVISPLDAFLVLRGIKTLELRMQRHSANAMTIAERLVSHPAVCRVGYPGLPGSPFHELARRQMSAFGGMIAFEMSGGMEAGIRFLDSLNLVLRAVSLGDTETLAEHPASMTHSAYSAEERAAHGISDGLVRLSVGIEDPEDIWNDLAQALDSCEPRLRAAAC